MIDGHITGLWHRNPFFLVTEPMTDELESTTTPQWAGVKQDRGQVAFSCDMSEADLEKFLVLL